MEINKDAIAMKLMEVEDHLDSFESKLFAVGVDTGNSDLQFIDIPIIVAMLYGLPVHEEDAANYVFECNVHLDGTLESRERFIERMKEWTD